MPLKNPGYVAGIDNPWSGDLNLALADMFGYRIKGVLWDELATLTGPDSGLSMLNLPLYSPKISRAYLRAAFNDGVKP